MYIVLIKIILFLFFENKLHLWISATHEQVPQFEVQGKDKHHGAYSSNYSIL